MPKQAEKRVEARSLEIKFTITDRKAIQALRAACAWHNCAPGDIVRREIQEIYRQRHDELEVKI